MKSTAQPEKSFWRGPPAVQGNVKEAGTRQAGKPTKTRTARTHARSSRDQEEHRAQQLQLHRLRRTSTTEKYSNSNAVVRKEDEAAAGETNRPRSRMFWRGAVRTRARAAESDGKKKRPCGMREDIYLGSGGARGSGGNGVRGRG